MAISLLGAMANPLQSKTGLPVASSTNSQNGNALVAPSQPMGQRAVSPNNNLKPTPSTLPLNQTDKSMGGALAGPLSSPAWNSIMGNSVPPSNSTAATNSTSTSSYAPISQPPTAQIPPVSPTTTPPTSTTGQPPTFPGLLTQAVNQQNSPYNTIARNSATTLQGLGTSNPGTSGPAYDAYQTAIQNEQNLKSGIAKEYGTIESQPIPLEFQQGREQVAARQNASLIDAAQQATNEKAAALGYGIQGNQAQQSAETGAANTALTGQGQTYGALQNAAGLAKPEVAGYGQTSFNPADNSFGANGGSNLDPQTQSTSFAQKVMSGQMTYDQAVSSMGYAGAAGKTFLDNAITSAGGNPLLLQASGAASQSNIQTGQTAAVNAGNTTYQQANPQYQRLANVVIPNIEGFGQLLMSGAGGINPFDSQHANMTLQQFQSELSSPQQAAFQTTFQQLQKSIAELAGSGGSQTPTANSAQADATLSPTSKMSTIKSTLDRISQEGQQYLKTQANYSNSALNQAQGGGGNAGSSNAPAGFGWNG